MGDIFTEINRRFNAGSILAKYIYINVGIFIIIRLAIIIMRLFIKDASFLEYIQMPSSWSLLAYRPWTIFTYMFVHFDFLHILFNMLWLYWFGKIFLMFFNGRQLGGLYVLGGIAGGLLFVISYQIFPFLRQFSENSFLIGASASIMAIVFAVSFYQKDYTINLLLLGRVKLIYLAIGVFLLDIIAITSENTGGHIAHIGGSLLGIFFASRYQKGKDITNFMNRIIDKFVNLITRKPSFKVYRKETHNARNRKNGRVETDDEYRRRKNNENRIIDEILDKLKRSGYGSLSTEEKKKLFDASRQ
ncbi:MAG: rhomboid family intramembrane serine protease [Prevotellaceae bacterium]|jgi:membrane associated rhomboid family serine protease|nr:rhomboid family intramembrane serine protease [Prevotellaceae bacterium]